LWAHYYLFEVFPPKKEDRHDPRWPPRSLNESQDNEEGEDTRRGPNHCFISHVHLRQLNPARWVIRSIIERAAPAGCSNLHRLRRRQPWPRAMDCGDAVDWMGGSEPGCLHKIHTAVAVTKMTAAMIQTAVTSNQPTRLSR
jgi:hypothetical protein